jgi:hypothetical protein
MNKTKSEQLSINRKNICHFLEIAPTELTTGAVNFYRDPINIKMKNIYLKYLTHFHNFDTIDKLREHFRDFRNDKISILKDNKRVYFDTLSNGEKIIYLAALMTVIIDRAKPKTRILAIDNLDNLDPHNFALMINGLLKLKSLYDNIILAGVVQGDLVFPSNWKELPKFIVNEFTVWNLTPEEALVDDKLSA